MGIHKVLCVPLKDAIASVKCLLGFLCSTFFSAPPFLLVSPTGVKVSVVINGRQNFSMDSCLEA